MVSDKKSTQLKTRICRKHLTEFKKIFWTEFLKKLQLSGNASELIRRPFLAAVLVVHPEEDALLGPMTDIDTSAARKQSLAIRADDRNAAPSIRLST